MIKDLEGRSGQERLKELGTFILLKRHLRGDMMAVCKYLKGCHKGEGKQLFFLTAEYGPDPWLKVAAKSV